MSALDFTVITGDDTTVKVNLTKKSDNSTPDITSVVVTVFDTASDTPLVVKESGDITITGGSFQFTITESECADWRLGFYPWKAVVLLTDGSTHTVNVGDTGLTRGRVQVT